jgi:hypothetical protein
MEMFFGDLIIFSYLMQIPLFYNVTYIGVIMPKLGIIFSLYAFLNFRAKKWLYSLGTEGVLFTNDEIKKIC